MFSIPDSLGENLQKNSEISGNIVEMFFTLEER